MAKKYNCGGAVTDISKITDAETDLVGQCESSSFLQKGYECN